jgi:hypothetical protein
MKGVYIPGSGGGFGTKFDLLGNKRTVHQFGCKEIGLPVIDKTAATVQADVKRLMDRCSKHRYLYKPPRTPEHFWNPDIIEGRNISRYSCFWTGRY